MLITILHVLQTMEIEFLNPVEGAEDSDHDCCVDNLKYNMQRCTEATLFPVPSDRTLE